MDEQGDAPVHTPSHEDGAGEGKVPSTCELQLQDIHIDRADIWVICCAIIAFLFPILPTIVTPLSDEVGILLLSLPSILNWLLPAVLVAEVIGAVSAYALGAIAGREDVTWNKILVAMLLLWLAGLPLVGEFPGFWLFGPYFLFPFSGQLVRMVHPNKIKIFRGIKIAAFLWSLVLLSVFIAKYVSRIPENDDYELSSLNGTCPNMRQYVNNVEQCSKYGRQANLPFSVTSTSSQSVGNCCVFDGGQLMLLPSRCAHGQEGQFVCHRIWVPFVAGEAARDLRLAIQQEVTESEQEVQCSFGLEHVTLRDPAGAEKEVCQRFYYWARLRVVGSYGSAVLYFVIGILAYLRCDYLVFVQLHQDHAHGLCELLWRSLLVLGAVVLLAIVILRVFGDIDLDCAPAFGVLAQACVLIPTVLSEIEIEPHQVCTWMYTQGNSIVKRVQALSMWQSPWVKVIAAYLLWPLTPVFVGLGFCCGKERLSAVRAWPWTMLLFRVNALALLLFVLAVLMGDAMNVGLSSLSAIVQSQPLAVVVISFFLFGLGVFMLPAVPGIVVYMGSGLLLGPAFDASGMPGWLKHVLVVAIALLCKMVGTFLQMQIGVLFGKSVKVRYLIRLHTPFMRAVKLMLQRPGFNIGKISVIVAGPDWPTGVLMGILGLRPVPIVAWTSLTFVVITPNAIAGGLLQYASTNDPRGVVGRALMLCGIGFQGVLTVLMLRAVSRATIQHADELKDKSSEHADLEELQARDDLYQAKLDRKTNWQQLPTGARLLHVTSALLFLIPSWAYRFAQSRCFNSFDLGADFQAAIEDGGLEGNFLNLFTGLGIAMLLLTAVACLLSVIFWRVVVPRLPEQPERDATGSTATDDVGSCEA